MKRCLLLLLLPMIGCQHRSSEANLLRPLASAYSHGFSFEPVQPQYLAFADPLTESILKHLVRNGRYQIAPRALHSFVRRTPRGAFYPDVFARRGIAIIAPNGEERRWIHDRYVGQLLKGEFREETRDGVISIVRRLRQQQNIDGVILGGTEITLLLSAPVVAEVPALDTTALHVAAIVKRLRM